MMKLLDGFDRCLHHRVLVMECSRTDFLDVEERMLAHKIYLNPMYLTSSIRLPKMKIHELVKIQTANTKHGFRILDESFSDSPAAMTVTLGFTWQFKKMAVFLGILLKRSLKLESKS